MNDAQTMSATDLARARDDPRIVILDVRPEAARARAALENPYFAVLYLPADSPVKHLRKMAALLVHELREMEVQAVALEGGTAGWNAL